MRKAIKVFTLFTAVIASCILALVIYYDAVLAGSYYVPRGKALNFNSAFISAKTDSKESRPVMGDTYPVCSKADIMLFNVIPVKSAEVLPVEVPDLVVGGEPFGIKIMTNGVMVVGLGEVDCIDGNKCPAVMAGIKTGDVIISVNDKSVSTNAEFQEELVASEGESLEIEIVRNNETIHVELQPAFSESDDTYKAGLWVRDSSAGIGTITYYDDETGCFGGLGHPICDADTGEILPLLRGEAVDVTINGVTKGAAGSPGELIGSFNSSGAIGNLYLNNKYGVFGFLSKAPNSSKEIPMALKQDVETGKATIYTTIEGSTPKEYDILIEKINAGSDDSSKNMVIRITDEELIKKTGGIVQGMSGSPIIQNGKLVGAVTHVFVNDPTKGFGIFAETMYDYSY